MHTKVFSDKITKYKTGTNIFSVIKLITFHRRDPVLTCPATSYSNYFLFTFVSLFFCRNQYQRAWNVHTTKEFVLRFAEPNIEM